MWLGGRAGKLRKTELKREKKGSTVTEKTKVLCWWKRAYSCLLEENLSFYNLTRWIRSNQHAVYVMKSSMMKKKWWIQMDSFITKTVLCKISNLFADLLRSGILKRNTLKLTNTVKDVERFVSTRSFSICLLVSENLEKRKQYKKKKSSKTLPSCRWRLG